jgi:hypothetical protein
MTAEEKLQMVKELTARDIEKQIQAVLPLIEGCINSLTKEDAVKQIEILLRSTVELTRSYAVMHSVNIQL